MPVYTITAITPDGRKRLAAATNRREGLSDRLYRIKCAQALGGDVLHQADPGFQPRGEWTAREVEYVLDAEDF